MLDTMNDGVASAAVPVRAAAVAADGRSWRALALLAGATLGPPLGGVLVLAYADPLGMWLRGHGAAGWVLFVGVVAVLTGSAIAPTYSFSVLAGWAFGSASGTVAGVLAYTLGAMLAFTVARRASGRWLADRVDRSRRWGPLRRALVQSRAGRAWLLVTLFRLPPNSPYALGNLLLASVGVPWRVFVAGTAVGLLPRTFAAAWLGSHLSELRFDQPRDWRWVAAAVVVTFVCLGIIGWIARRTMQRLTG